MAGGNIWQGALIGGISGGVAGGVGIAVEGWDWVPRGVLQVGTGALVGGAVAELTGGKFYEGAIMGAVSGAVGFVASELVGSYMRAERLAASDLRDVEGLGAAMEEAQRNFIRNDYNRNLSNRDAGEVRIDSPRYEAARQIFYRMVDSLSPEIKFWTTFDLSHGGFKVGPYHFQEISGSYYLHFERNILTNFAGHMVWEWWRY